MVSGSSVIVSLWPHKNFWVLSEVKLSDFDVFVQRLPVLFKIKVCEEAGVDVLTKKLTELKDHFVLNCLKALRVR